MNDAAMRRSEARNEASARVRRIASAFLFGGFYTEAQTCS